MACGEFSLVARYLDRVKSARLDVETGIGNDYALLNILEKETLAISIDTLVAGNHFLPDIGPADLAYKALAVNLSDLAAMGTEPAWLTLTLTLPRVGETWLETSNGSLLVQLDYYDMQPIDGDTTHDLLPMTLDIHDFVPPGYAMKRVGAKPGDWACITGTLGDNAAGLAMLQNRLTVDEPSDADYLLARHLHPMSCVLQGQALHDLATSTIDLSDGLISDLDHILKASGYDAHIDLDAMSYSDATLYQVEPKQALRWAFAGGEDYELCLAIPELSRGVLDVALGHLGARLACIEQIALESEGLQFTRDGKPVAPDLKGYDHFMQSRRGTTPPGHA